MKKMIAAALTVLLLYGLYRFSLPSPDRRTGRLYREDWSGGEGKEG